MSRGIADVVTFATGLDPYGDPSFVTLGISGLYVASMLPTPGTTDDEILRELEALLDSNGILTTFDPVQVALSFDMPILDGQTVVWGTDDPGLDFGASFEVIGVAPAPTSGTLIAAGLLALAAACRLIRLPAANAFSGRHVWVRWQHGPRTPHGHRKATRTALWLERPVRRQVVAGPRNHRS